MNSVECYRSLSFFGAHQAEVVKGRFMDQDKWLTIDELADYLKMGRTKLYRMTQDGKIPASKIGSQWRFDREEIDEWMKDQRPMAAIKNSKGGS